MPHSLARIPPVWVYHARTHSATPLESEGAVSTLCQPVTQTWNTTKQWETWMHHQQIANMGQTSEKLLQQWKGHLEQTNPTGVKKNVYLTKEYRNISKCMFIHYCPQAINEAELYMKAPVNANQLMPCFDNKWLLNGWSRICVVSYETISDARQYYEREHQSSLRERMANDTHVWEGGLWGWRFVLFSSHNLSFLVPCADFTRKVNSQRSTPQNPPWFCGVTVG